MSAVMSPLAPQFDNPEQQSEAAHTGMWVFLAGEVLFFGVMFFGYAVTRIHYPHAFAEAGRHTDVVLGTLNTAVLLTSSYAMALALHFGKARQSRRAVRLLAVTLLLGLGFLAIKGTEYHADYLHHLWPGASFRFAPPLHDGARLFFYLYFVMTGFHALHLLIGMALVGWTLKGLRQGDDDAGTHLEMTALYWHFVDVVWIFLYPLYYLVLRT